MSAKVTKKMSVNIAAGTFKTFEEAVKSANAIKIWLTRLCERKGYSCKAIIGASENNPHTGKVVRVKTGKCGRPKNTFVRDSGIMRPTMTDPHIHIVLIANPAETVAQALVKHLNTKYGKRVTWAKECRTKEHFENAISYLKRQSLKIRYAEINTSPFLFTPSEGEETVENAGGTSVLDGSNATEELQCKSNKYYNYKKYNIKKYFNILHTSSKSKALLRKTKNKIILSDTSPPS